MSNSIEKINSKEHHFTSDVPPWDNFGSLMTDIDGVLQNEICSRHSYFQLKYFLIGKEPTNQAKMWQCLRELKTRKESLVSLVLEIEDIEDRLELLDINIKRIEERALPISDLDKQELKIQLRQIERQKVQLNDNLKALKDKRKWLLQECNFFLQTFNSIQKVEPLKPFDDLDCQKQYWEAKLSQKLHCKLLTNSHLDNELLETIFALPDEMSIKKHTLATMNERIMSVAKKVEQIKE